MKIKLLLFITMFLSFTATAQEAFKRWSLGVYAQPGYTYSSHLYIDYNVGIANGKLMGGAVGVRGRFAVTPKFALGLGAGYAHRWHRNKVELPTDPPSAIVNRFQLRDVEVPISLYIALSNPGKKFSLLFVPELTAGFSLGDRQRSVYGSSTINRTLEAEDTPERLHLGVQLLARIRQPSGGEWLFGPSFRTNTRWWTGITRGNIPGHTLGLQAIYFLPFKNK